MARDFRIVEPIGHSTSLFGRAMTRERDARIKQADLEMRQQRESRQQQSFVQGAPIREYQTNKAIADSSMLRSQVQAANTFEKNRPQHQQTFTKLMDPNQWIKTDGTRDHEGWRNAALEFSTNISSAIEYSTDAESMANVLLPEMTRQAAVVAQIKKNEIEKIQKAEALAEVKRREREDRLTVVEGMKARAKERLPPEEYEIYARNLDEQIDREELGIDGSGTGFSQEGLPANISAIPVTNEKGEIVDYMIPNGKGGLVRSTFRKRKGKTSFQADDLDLTGSMNDRVKAFNEIITSARSGFSSNTNPHGTIQKNARLSPVRAAAIAENINEIEEETGEEYDIDSELSRGLKFAKEADRLAYIEDVREALDKLRSSRGTVEIQLDQPTTEAVDLDEEEQRLIDKFKTQE